MRIRRAQQEDAEQLAQLNYVFNESIVSAQQIADYLADCPEHEVTVVAEIDRVLAGFACLQRYRSWCYPEPWAELTELYVAPEHRRQGVGRAMVRSLEEIARDLGATEIVLLAGKQNITGQSFYRSCGYTGQEKASFCKNLQNERG